MRSMVQYHSCHLMNSINFPIDHCDDDFFLNFDCADIIKNVIRNPDKKKLFEKRKRLFVYVIGSQTDITYFIPNLHKLFTA